MKHKMEIPAFFLEQLKKIYIKMDKAYNNASAHYGFECRGCQDNCCMTRFFHHTFLEYEYVKKGYYLLKPEIRAEVKKTALEVCRKTSELQKENKEIRLMCPLNFNSLCLIYEYRPMICRLHGIAHELHKAQNIVHSPGCGAFTDHTRGMSYYKFDRTPFYFEMAGLENKLKQAVRINQKIKMTIAEMIESF